MIEFQAFNKVRPLPQRILVIDCTNCGGEFLASKIPDEQTWKELGGYQALRHVEGLSKPDVVAVVQTARTFGRAPLNVMRERGLNRVPTPGQVRAQHQQRMPAPPTPVPAPVAPAVPVNDQYDAAKDAEFFVRFIFANCKNIPRDVLLRAHRYTQGSVTVRKKAA